MLYFTIGQILLYCEFVLVERPMQKAHQVFLVGFSFLSSLSNRDRKLNVGVRQEWAAFEQGL